MGSGIQGNRVSGKKVCQLGVAGMSWDGLRLTVPKVAPMALVRTYRPIMEFGSRLGEANFRFARNPEAGAVPETSPMGRDHGHASSGPHRDTITFIPYGDTILALSTFAGRCCKQYHRLTT